MLLPQRYRSLLLTGALFLSASLVRGDSVPEDLVLSEFSGPDITPSPACLCVSAHGEVFAGIDLNGSLGKGPGRGRIVKLTDTDKDGVADEHTVFAELDNPRGLVSVGDALYVLHTAFSEEPIMVRGKDGEEVETFLSTGMDLVVLHDRDQDGVADGPAELLVSGICSADAINSRGTDHSTNGIQLGIDGWIYIAIGDFGFANATGKDGTELTLLGGGIVRVRPDGTEMELYTTGMRNIYDVAIDPFMNIFTRGNTNDGGGWNVRFNHHIQSGEYGYPRLFINFADEIIPALEDVGGGSGVGAFFLSEPTWPEAYNNQPLMADWGRQAIYLHRLEEDGPTFLQEAEEFARISQVSDLDVDPAGQMFASAWNGAGFRGDETKGYIVRIVPEGWVPSEFPKLTEVKTPDLVLMLESASATTRLHVQQELLQRRFGKWKPEVEAMVADSSLPLENRVAALYTLAQKTEDPVALLAYAEDDDLREFALRAATDRLPKIEEAELSLEPFVAALGSGTPRQKAAAAIALGRLGNEQAADALLAVSYEKPEPEGKPVSTELYTVKGNREVKVKLDVTPGEKLYLSLTETNPGDEVSTLAFLEPTFVTADLKKRQMGEKEPVEGTVFADQTPDGKAFPTKKGKNPPKHFLTARPGEPIVYRVPNHAVRLESKVVALGGSVDFIASTVPPGEAGAGEIAMPRHATPNPGVIVPHLAVRSLEQLNAVEASLQAIGTSSEDLALWSLSYMHDEAAVEGLIARLEDARDEAQRDRLLTTISRLYQQEAPYDGSWWWSTRPDTRGPYYKPVTWAASETIAGVLKDHLEDADEELQTLLAGLNDRHRLGIEELGTNLAPEDMEEQPTVDLAKIASQEGAVGKTPIEDIILSLDELKGDPERGEILFTQQGCMACHALSQDGPVLGPYMGQIGSIMNPEQIATAILRPGDTISQGFQTAQIFMKDGSLQVGFVTESNTDYTVLRDMAGKVTKLKSSDIKEEKQLPMSMMPEGLANALSLEDFASLVAFLATKK